MDNSIWYVYMLLCDQKTYYIGITNDLRKRLNEHRNKMSLYTSRFSDIKLVYCEEYIGKYEAAKREKQLKGWSNAKKHMLIEGTLGRNQCNKLVEVISQDENR